MKKTALYRRNLTLHRYQPPCPKAPASRNFWDRLLDQVTLAVSAMGFACAMAFLTTLV